jgi:hypothetical protein
MNPLQNLIADELDAQNLKRSELCERMGYQNVSKCLRKLDTMMETLENREWLLPLIQKALKIPDDKFQTAISALEDEIFEKNSATFKPSIWVMYKNRLNFFSAYGRTMYLDVPENVSTLANEMEIIRGICSILADKNDISIRKGFIYHRFQGVDIVINNDLRIVNRK